MAIPKLLTRDDDAFPDPSLALTEPNGLLAIGGQLSISQLFTAYRQGIFPWYMSGQPLLWWSPNPRAVIFLDKFRINRSLKKVLNKNPYRVTLNNAFGQVVEHCAAPRPYESQTWITPEMQLAYCEMHEVRRAHSVEVWEGNTLVGGLYGVDCGRIFAGESMFSHKTNASKIALVYLVQFLKTNHYQLIDCQLSNPFLYQFGTCEIPRADFIKLLEESYPQRTLPWQPQELELDL